MTNTEVEKFKEMLTTVRDENRVSARESALQFIRNPANGAAQRKALSDDATGEAYANALNVLESITNPET